MCSWLFCWSAVHHPGSTNHCHYLPEGSAWQGYLPKISFGCSKGQYGHWSQWSALAGLLVPNNLNTFWSQIVLRALRALRPVRRARLKSVPPFFLPFFTIWTIWDHLESFGTMLDHFGHFFVILTIFADFGDFWPFLAILDHFWQFLPFITILHHFEPFWTI